MKYAVPFICSLLLVACTNRPVTTIQTTPTPTALPSSGFASPPSTTGSTASNADMAQQAMQTQLAQKYNKAAGDVTIAVTTTSGSYATGTVSYKGEPGGGKWFAVKQKGGWLLVHDGQGPMSCTLANQYQFPNSMVPACLNQQGQVVMR